MSLSKNIHTYADIEAVLSGARAASGAVLETASPGAATKWRSRAYQYRKLLATAADGRQVATPWDDMLLQVSGADVVISFGPKAQGILRTFDGVELPLGPAREPGVPATDPLMEEAMRLLEGE